MHSRCQTGCQEPASFSVLSQKYKTLPMKDMKTGARVKEITVCSSSSITVQSNGRSVWQSRSRNVQAFVNRPHSARLEFSAERLLEWNWSADHVSAFPHRSQHGIHLLQHVIIVRKSDYYYYYYWFLSGVAVLINNATTLNRRRVFRISI